MAAVVVQGGSKVPTVNAVGRVGSSCIGVLMDDAFESGWCERGASVVEGSVELGIGGELWVDS